MRSPLRLRRAGRVIVLDPEDRVLLFRYDQEAPNGQHWATPGGGLNDGEDFLEGARRELTEETGWTDVTVGGEVVLERIFPMGLANEVVRQHEQIFLGRTEIPRRAIEGVGQMHASDGIAAWRWWALPELDTTTEVIWPRELPDLIRKMSGLAGKGITERDGLSSRAWPADRPSFRCRMAGDDHRTGMMTRRR